MDALALLLERQSNPFLVSPAPTQEHLEIILKSGMRVPDHGGLTPWHFTVFEGEGLNTLSNSYVKSASQRELEISKQEKASRMAFRAPMVIMVTTQLKQHDKVPQQEQIITAGCAAHAMQMCATALGYGAMWRTGDMAYCNIVKGELNVAVEEEIVGFLYIGTKQKELPVKPERAKQSHITYVTK